MSDDKTPEVRSLEIHRDTLKESVRQRQAGIASATGIHKAELQIVLDGEQARLNSLELQFKELSKPSKK